MIGLLAFWRTSIILAKPKTPFNLDKNEDCFSWCCTQSTGSKHLLTLEKGTQILLDCGMFQGMGDVTNALNGSFGFDVKEVNHLLLSHAHIDHCGSIPKLIKEGFAGTIYCTAATRTWLYCCCRTRQIFSAMNPIFTTHITRKTMRQ